MARTDADGLLALDRAECMARLAEQSFGRVALTVAALPTVLPVVYCVLHDRIFFRTTRHPRLAAATNGAVLAFEIDRFDGVGVGGWSVVVVGLATHVSDELLLGSLEAAGLPQWTPTGDSLVVEISIDLLHGRVLQAAAT